MATLLFHVDAFTRVPFRGNPAVVVVLDAVRERAWMQAVAAEMNVSETAFALSAGDGTFALRWFTPTVEVPLCGHATLATAAVLLGEKIVEGPLVFHTASGDLTVARAGAALALSLPAYDAVPAAGDAIVAALGVAAREVLFSRASQNLLVRVESEEELVAAKPSFAALREADTPDGVLGVIVTAEGATSEGALAPHFVSRYFAPWVGIDEDPVTGSAHAVLGPYWAARLGRKKLLAAQRSARGGEIGVEVAEGRVIVTGSCCVVSRGVWVD
jgi:PhzF family phenazine biosynthesis protein